MDCNFEIIRLIESLDLSIYLSAKLIELRIRETARE